jgi:HAD superfamily hydrolase (TIGR01456 family)
MDKSMFVQSHTPFAEMTDLFDKTILVAGGDGDKCAAVARGYGFKNVVTPADLVVAHPEIWPFAKVFKDYYESFANPLPKPIDANNKANSLKIDAVFVYNDPRDWGLDASVILDLLLSEQGILGTLSSKNGDKSLPNNGYLQDSQPHLYYSNPDLWWAAKYHLPRLGQGGFREAFAGLWSATTGNATLEKTVMGKPHQPTYEFAERLLRKYRKNLYSSVGLNDPLRRVYMIGDNPESDIRGANNYRSPYGSEWRSCLVETGVYAGGEPPEGARPDVVSKDVGAAVKWALKDAGWQG